jgi:hydroxymethylpyrimidine/phosphomethylpyrimidine kinase
MGRHVQTLLSLAGFDPSAGAGVLLDLRIFSEHGFHAAAVLTSVTVQNTQAVREVHPFPQSFILKQFESLAADLNLAGIKVGMLGGRGGIRALGLILERARNIPRVVDPVFRSTSGFWLMDKKSIPDYLTALKGRASLFTPNIPEAELILGQKIRDAAEMKSAARRISRLTGIPCLLKGAHLAGAGNEIADVLYNGRRFAFFSHKKIRKDVHGTGCFLSSTALAYLARGCSLERACRRAVEQTVRAIARSRPPGVGRPVLSISSARPAERRSPHQPAGRCPGKNGLPVGQRRPRSGST